MPSTPPIKVPILGEDKYSKEFSKMAKKAKAVGQQVTQVGRGLTRAVTLPALAIGGASIKFSRDLNKAMANVGTLIPKQTARLARFKEEVMALSVETGTAQTDVAEGQYDVISAFGSAEDPMKKLAITAKMAKAGVSNMREALALTSAVTKGYGDTTDEAVQKVSDFAFKTVELGQTTFPELAAAIGKVVPLATTLKNSQRELFAVMATGTGVTGTAAEVSTQYASALGAFIKPSTSMTKAAKKLGYESSVAMIKELGFVESLKKLQEITGGSEIAMGKLLTRKEGLNLALTLLGKQSDTFAEKFKQMGNVVGATDAAFREQTEGINKEGFAMDQAVESLKRAGVQLGDRLLPIVVRFTESLIPLVDRVSKMSDAQLDWGIKIAAGAAVLGPFLILTGKLIASGPPILALFRASRLLVTKYTASMVAASTATGIQTAQTASLGVAQKTTNATLATGAKQFGLLKTAGSVFAAGIAGWTVGTIIYETLVKPLQESLSLIRKAKDEVKKIETAGGVESFSEKSLEQSAAVFRTGIAEEQKKLDELNQSVMARGGISAPKSSAKMSELMEKLREVEAQIGKKKFESAIKEDLSASGFKGAEDAGLDPLLLPEIGQTQQGADGKIIISFEGLPDGVTPKVTRQQGQRIETQQRTGQVMQGAF